MAKIGRFKSVLLLNSQKAVEAYNKRHRATKFKYLVDPVPSVDPNCVKSVRSELGIDKDSIVFLHFGVMQRRKGTIELMKAILMTDSTKKRTFVFAGKVTFEIKDEFYSLKRDIENRGFHIIVIDEFIRFDELNNLCYTSDCILAPYLGTACSSGVIGYGAVFQKPVIGNSDGLLGELIKDNELGMVIPVTPHEISKAINSFTPYRTNSDYAETHTVEAFYKTVLE